MFPGAFAWGLKAAESTMAHVLTNAIESMTPTSFFLKPYEHASRARSRKALYIYMSVQRAAP